MRVALLLSPEGGFDHTVFLAEPAVVRQDDARAFLAFLKNRSCYAANLAIHGYEDAFNHCHTWLDAKGAPFDAPPSHVREWRLSPTFLTAQISRWGFP